MAFVKSTMGILFLKAQRITLYSDVKIYNKEYGIRTEGVTAYEHDEIVYFNCFGIYIFNFKFTISQPVLNAL